MLIPYDPEWYLKQIAKHGVSHPAAGGYTINPGVKYPEAKNYSASRQDCIDYQADIFRRLNFRLEGQRVLEFGCGNLMTHDSLLKYGLDSSNYVGVELIKEFREYGAERGIKVVETVKEADPMVSSGLAFNYVFVVELYCQFVDERGVISHLRKMASYARLGLITVFTLNKNEGFTPSIDVLQKAFPNQEKLIAITPWNILAAKIRLRKDV